MKKNQNVSCETIRDFIMSNKVLIISGPTASGKSSLALEIAKQKKSVIINADSVQLYKELPILSAQPNKIELAQNHHKLYSILNYFEQSSLNLWLELAKQEIEKSFQNKKLPIIVGGTGLYLSKLIDGISPIPEIEAKTKQYCFDIFQNYGKEGLIKNLLELNDNPEKILKLDKQRLLRRLEILKQTSKTLCHWQSLPLKTFFDKEDFIHINLNPSRDFLYQNCNKRFEVMLKNGAIEEVITLLKLTNNEIDFPIVRTIGFLEIKNYLDGVINKNNLIEISSQKTRNYAKRQLTWFRHQFKNKIEIENVSHETIKLILNLL